MALLDVVFNPVEDLVGDIDILGDVGLGLFAPDHSAGDTDLNLGLDLDIVDNGLLNPAYSISVSTRSRILSAISTLISAWRLTCSATPPTVLIDDFRRRYRCDRLADVEILEGLGDNLVTAICLETI
jgi:hypothetical protein